MLAPAALGALALCGLATQPTRPPSPAAAPPHLRYMSMYGFDAPKMQGWINMGMEGPLQDKLAAWAQYRIPSLYGKLSSSASCADADGVIFQRGHGLCPGWEASLEALAAKEILPHLGEGKALRGVFLG